MKKLSLFFLLSISLLIGIADFATTNYGLSIGLIEGDGLYIPFLSTVALFGVGMFADYLSMHTKFRTEKDKQFFNYFSVSTITVLGCFMVFPIINNLSLII